MDQPGLQAALLGHPSICQDQQVALKLLQTSKQLQAAVTDVLQGQLSLIARSQKLEHAASLMQWLQKHACLLQQLEIQLAVKHLDGARKARWSNLITALESALQHAGAASLLKLKAVALGGFTASPGLLQALPAAHLTHLCAEVRLDDSASMQALAALTGLRTLQLRWTDGRFQLFRPPIPENVLAPLAALQQLTQLHINPVRPEQMQWLPTTLQQLHATVDARGDPEQLLHLARWMMHHAKIVRTLKLTDTVPFHFNSPAWRIATAALAAAFYCGTTAAEKAAAADAAPAVEAAASSCQLQALTMESYGGNLAEPAWPRLQHLPAHSLTRLACCLDWGSAAQTGALLALTALRSLQLGNYYRTGQKLYRFMSEHAVDVLAPLSALQQLVSLELVAVQRAQLQHLQLPQLRQLHVHIDAGLSGGQPLQLAHLTALQQLTVKDTGAAIRVGDSLPFSLCTLDAMGCGHRKGFSSQPLLVLSNLRKLQLHASTDGASAGELAQLSSLSSLQEVKLTYAAPDRGVAEADAAAIAAAWSELPVAVLEQQGSASSVTTAAASTYWPDKAVGAV
jgi:hypothetical protein